LRLGKSASVGQKRLDGGDGCFQAGYNQLQHRVWWVRVRLSLGALLPRPKRSELLNYFVLEFVQGFRAGHKPRKRPTGTGIERCKDMIQRLSDETVAFNKQEFIFRFNPRSEIQTVTVLSIIYSDTRSRGN
jgi:hypothetical protein